MPDEQTELKYMIALSMAPAIGPVTARKLIKEIGSAEEVFLQKRKALEKIEGIGPFLSRCINEPSLIGKAERELEFIEKHHISVLHYKNPVFPKLLNECQDGPILLYSIGDHSFQCERNLSVVGTRRASPYGKEICREIIKDLAFALPDLVIVSGLAYGIDVIAHRAALEYGLETLAVLGHGLSTIYPASHRETAKRITHQGALITDFHSDIGPERNNFLRRNRIIAGLSRATLIVESAKKGGALITADIAFSYSREVLSIPGRAKDDRSRGCNALIKSEMATLVESAADIVEQLNWDKNSETLPFAEQKIDLGPEENKILFAIEEVPDISPGMLSKLLGIPLQNVLALLLEMELKEWISVEPGNRYRSRISLH